MSITDFVRYLGDDREFQLQVAGHKYIQPKPPRYGELEVGDRLKAAFSQKGVDRLYLHQTETVGLVRKGVNVVLMTPTASGKSLAYNIPVLETIMENPGSTALCLFPLKGLEQDQLRNLNELSGLLGLEETGKVYDGDTISSARRDIREFLPHVIFTNPDMLHLAIMAFHNKWEEFFRNLKFIVIDEIHSYRGVFGSHVAQVFRRLRRVCDFYDSSPTFIAASATIADPSKLAGDLTGLPFETVRENGAPSAGKHFYFMNPIESPYTAATRLFVQCMKAGLRTIVFTKARKITELIYTWTLNYAPELQGKISPYRAGFLPKERREIEARLFRGELLGVVSTSALELGVDIGGLDCCILCGYPGSVSSTWQRAGRVGRQGEESLVVLIAGQDALDHYFMRHPGEFFEKSHEAAVVDAENKNILKKHLVCAAAELPLSRDDAVYDMERHMPVIDELVSEGVLSPGKRGDVWFSVDKHPQRQVAIRAVGERFALVNEAGRHIGELSGWRVFGEAFPGAIYLHRGRQHSVLELDITKKKAVCKEVRSQYYTQPLSEGKTEIIEEQGKKGFRGTEFSWGRLRMTQRIIGYDRKRIFDKVRIATHALSLPEYVFETEGVWTVIDRKMKAEIESGGFDLGGTLHALEHAAIACMPLFALCDRGDIGGLSHTGFPDFGLPAIFVYDGHEGGVGLSKRAFEVPGDWLKATLGIIEECPCTGGCPSCVQDPQCGNRNEPLDKEGAKFLLRKWLAGS
ncbi:MAG: DEAD/DEAH box helicase [Thermodesulfovibrionales bacterium]